jgi:hypothetical protein
VTAVSVALPDPAPGVLVCGKKHPTMRSVYCDRLDGHDGGHLSRPDSIYWQAGEPTS